MKHQLAMKEPMSARLHTSPWWTSEDNCIFAQLLVLLRYDLETVTFDKPDLVFHPIDFGIVFCAFEDFRISFDREDSLKSSRERESN